MPTDERAEELRRFEGKLVELSSEGLLTTEWTNVPVTEEVPIPQEQTTPEGQRAEGQRAFNNSFAQWLRDNSPPIDVRRVPTIDNLVEGDIVRIRPDTPRGDVEDYFECNAIYRGDNTESDTDENDEFTFIALEREDGIHGDAQNGLWSFANRDIRYLEFAGKTKPKRKLKKGELVLRWAKRGERTYREEYFRSLKAAEKRAEQLCKERLIEMDNERCSIYTLTNGWAIRLKKVGEKRYGDLVEEELDMSLEPLA